MKNLKSFRPSFIYPEVKEKDRSYASCMSGAIIREDGDWRDYLPPNEDQNVGGVESSACYIEAQQATIATIREEEFGIKDKNYSARFNALLSNGTEDGGDPLKGGYSIKHDGLIPQELMDWQGIDSWGDFHSWKGVNKERCISEGLIEAHQWEKIYKIVAEREDPLEIKYINLIKALKRSPVPLSVYAWLERGGKYYKPRGLRDNHLVMALHVDKDNSITIRDTYYPYIKVLEPNYDFDFAMYWMIRPKSKEEQLKESQLSLIQLLQKYVVFLLSKIYQTAGEVVSGIFSKRN